MKKKVGIWGIVVVFVALVGFLAFKMGQVKSLENLVNENSNKETVVSSTKESSTESLAKSTESETLESTTESSVADKDTLTDSERENLVNTTVYTKYSGPSMGWLSYLVKNEDNKLDIFSQYAAEVAYDYSEQKLSRMYVNLGSGSALYNDAIQYSNTETNVFSLNLDNYDLVYTYVINDVLSTESGHSYLLLATKKDNDIVITLHLIDTNNNITEQNRLENPLLILKPVNDKKVAETKDFAYMLNPDESLDKFYLDLTVSNIMSADSSATQPINAQIFVNMYENGNYAYKSTVPITDMQTYKLYMMIMLYDKMMFNPNNI